jgi:ankyrin repeat protein
MRNYVGVAADDTDPLWLAIEHDRPDDLRRLLASGRSPTYDDPRGWSPLHHAVDIEGDAHNQVNADLDLRLVGPLLDAHADVNAIYTDAAGRRETPWDLAAVYRHVPAQDAIEAKGGGADRRN